MVNFQDQKLFIISYGPKRGKFGFVLCTIEENNGKQIIVRIAESRPIYSTAAIAQQAGERFLRRKRDEARIAFGP